MIRVKNAEEKKEKTSFSKCSQKFQLPKHPFKLRQNATFSVLFLEPYQQFQLQKQNTKSKGVGDITPAHFPILSQLVLPKLRPR